MRDPGHFWSKVDISQGPEACWPFLGCRNEKGYGVIWWPAHVGARAGMRKAHRVAWELANSARLPSRTKTGLMLRHRCDNPACCNPAHLVLGDNCENMADMKARGRSAKGARNGFSKHTEDEIREVRQRLKSGQSHRQIERETNVARGVVGYISNRGGWSHVK